MMIHFIKNDCGATAVEYGLIAAGIALTIVGAVYAFGGDLNTMFFSTLPGLLSGPSS